MKSLILMGIILGMFATGSYATESTCTISGTVELSGRSASVSGDNPGATIAQCEGYAEYQYEVTEWTLGADLYGYGSKSLEFTTSQSGTMTYNGVKYTIRGDDELTYDIYNQWDTSRDTITFSAAASTPVAAPPVSNPDACSAKYPQYRQYWPILREYHYCD
jgi:hypothetical protein